VKAVSASKRKLIDDSDEEEEWEPAEGEQTIQDPVTAEIERWKAALGESLDTYKDENRLFLNEFQLWWEFKDQFPLPNIVLKQFASSPPLACIFGMSRLYFTCILPVYLTVSLVSRVSLYRFYICPFCSRCTAIVSRCIPLYPAVSVSI